jgi:hypothetical protein
MTQTIPALRLTVTRPNTPGLAMDSNRVVIRSRTWSHTVRTSLPLVDVRVIVARVCASGLRGKPLRDALTLAFSESAQ